MTNPADAAREKARDPELAWKVVSTATAIVGGIAARKVLEWGWTKFSSSGNDPSLNPADRRISWSEAVLWAVASGVGVGLARLVSQRGAAAGWEMATGETPPGIEA